MKRTQLDQVLVRAEELCTEQGARLTRQRRTVLELICASNTPLSAYEILDRMRGSIRNPAPPTVYRALDFLLQHGLIHKLESLHAFIGCPHPEHPHASQFLICADCGEVNELENEAVIQSLQSAAKTTGFETKRPVVEVWGTCAQCSEKHLNER